MARISFAVFLAAALVAWGSGCPSTTQWVNLPPSQQLYFPTGVVHVDSPLSADGVLFVANANFDKRYATGSLMALNLSKLGLPVFGAPVGASGPVQITDLKTDDAGIVLISSFAGEMASLDLGQGRTRLFIPSRSEGMKLQAIDADALTSSDAQPVLHCSTPQGSTPSDCATNAVSLSPKEFEQSPEGLPRAPGPFGVSVRPRTCPTGHCSVGSCVAGACMTTNNAGVAEPFADVFVTHLTQADSPLASGLNPRGYLVRVASQGLAVTQESFIFLGPGATSSVTHGPRYVFASGRGLNPAGKLLRLVDPNTAGDDGGTRVMTAELEQTFKAFEARGLALSSNQRRIYMATRVPDSLVVASIDDPMSDLPRVQATHAISVPASPNEVRVISRPGRSDLVAIACTGASAVVLYDDEVGDLVGQVNGVGLSPFDISVDRRGDGARLYVSNFDDGRIAVIDIPSLDRPHEARLVAHLGTTQQLCLTQGQRIPSLCDAGTLAGSL